MKLPLFFALALPAVAHHGQDFLVAIDAGVNRPWEFRTTLGEEYTDYSPGYESSLTQSIILGLPKNFTFSNFFRYADNGTGSWDTLSVTPMLQWTTPELGLRGPLTSLHLAIAAGWEIPINQGHDHGEIPLTDCSSLVAIPPAFFACQLANQNAANHTHGAGGHGHNGIHRHGVSHGFLRLVAELNPTPRDRIVFNSITVFPEDDSPQWGYAAAYRHRFASKFALGVEAIGDFDANGEHLVYLTGTSYLTHHLSLTIGAATGLTEASPELTLQTLLSWRF